MPFSSTEEIKQRKKGNGLLTQEGKTAKKVDVNQFSATVVAYTPYSIVLVHACCLNENTIFIIFNVVNGSTTGHPTAVVGRSSEKEGGADIKAVKKKK